MARQDPGFGPQGEPGNDLSVLSRSVTLMNFTFTPPVPAEQIRQLPTRDVALLLLQHLASSSSRHLRFTGLISRARQAFEGEQDADARVTRTSASERGPPHDRHGGAPGSSCLVFPSSIWQPPSGSRFYLRRSTVVRMGVAQHAPTAITEVHYHRGCSCQPSGRGGAAL